jgi:hypothetical protein
VSSCRCCLRPRVYLTVSGDRRRNYTKAIQLNPLDSRSFNNRGYTVRPDALTSALRPLPSPPLPSARLATPCAPSFINDAAVVRIQHDRMGNHALALRDYEAAIRIVPHEANFRFNAGVVCMVRGVGMPSHRPTYLPAVMWCCSSALCCAALLCLCIILPSPRLAMSGCVHQRLSDFEGAVQHLSDAIERDGTEPMYHRARAMALRLCGRFTEALMVRASCIDCRASPSLSSPHHLLTLLPLPMPSSA